MNISPVNSSKASFGKISWGTPEKAKKSEAALIKLKETNDIDGIKMLKYNDVIEQLQILSEHPDTFQVSCSIIEGHHDASFDINVFEQKSRALISSFSEYFIADYKKSGVKIPVKNDIKSFAQNVLHKHKSEAIKQEVASTMKLLGTVEKTNGSQIHQIKSENPFSF